MDLEKQKRCINFLLINQLLQKAAENFHTIFRERWIILRNHNNFIKKWNDNEISGTELVQLPACSGIAAGFKENLKTGKVDLWDVSLSCLVIQAVNKEIQKLGGKTIEEENKLIVIIKDIRNKIAHGNSELADEEFTVYWNELTENLLKLGEDATVIENLKINFLKINEPKGNVKSEYIKLKTQGKNLFKGEKYEQTIEIYNEMLKLPDLSPEKQAAIYGNRSLAYIKSKKKGSFAMAKKDAEYAVQLWPCWWKGYYFLGHVHIALEEWREAEKALEKALTLNSKAKDVVEIFSYVRQQKAFTIYHENKEYLTSVKYQKSFNEKEADKLVEVLQNAPFWNNVYEGHKYMSGDGVPRDFAKAAAYYSTAAHDGIPDGMYYLSICLKDGNGVKQNHDESLRWLFQAANEEAHIHKGQEGVREAQHTLGLIYETGDGLKQDYSKAIEWYKKAIDNGYGGSANNLAIMYKNGKGVEQSESHAFSYYKIAAELGDIPGIENLAHCYLTANCTGKENPSEEDIEEGIKWLEMCAKKNDKEKSGTLVDHIWSYSADVEAVKKLIAKPEAFADPLNKNLYEKDVKIAARKGSATAKKMLLIWKFLGEAQDAYEKKDSTKLVANLSKAIQQDHRILQKKIPACYTDMINADPSLLLFLFYRGVILQLIRCSTPEYVKAWNDYITAAPEDDDKIPECHYRKAQHFLTLKDMTSFVKSYEAGLEAEKMQLPCFLPYTSRSKAPLTKHYVYEKLKDPNLVKRVKKADLQKLIYKFPTKANMLIKHRNIFADDKSILDGTFKREEKKKQSHKFIAPHPIT